MQNQLMNIDWRGFVMFIVCKQQKLYYLWQ